ncbi:hypothetical protein BCR35DRAFT_311075 [Leucosporidium creatinivorum]|uniref:F-box domain-containing protein n=1 Tax=Leucosporidium creatinivorum TaxID=106004 RepID=A0A1Y2CFN8_9BASI|nr:hypothetical protein BCR35DRAFT_311075 [Leucosporidium creatinivorum]
MAGSPLPPASSSSALSASSAASDATSLPSLPLELVQLILDFAVPPPGYGEWTERKSILHAFALVSRRWRETYQPQLFGDVVLRTANSALRFKESAGNVKLAKLVNTIRVGSQWEGQPKGFDGDASKCQLGDIFRRCTSLKTLQIGRMDNVDEQDIAAAERLESLAIWDSLIGIPGSYVTLSLAVRHLFLDGNAHVHSGELSFASRFPHLSALAIAVPPPPFHDPRPRSLPALKALSLRNNDAVINWDSLKGLLLLHCDVEFLRNPSVFDALPSSLRYLRVTSGHFFGSDVLTPGLRSQEARLANLEELILPLRLSTAAAFEGLRSWAREKNLKIRWERDEDGQGTVWDEGFWECVRRVEAEVRRRSKPSVDSP